MPFNNSFNKIPAEDLHKNPGMSLVFDRITTPRRLVAR